MKKILCITIIFLLLLSGCKTQEKPSQEKTNTEDNFLQNVLTYETFLSYGSMDAYLKGHQNPSFGELSLKSPTNRATTLQASGMDHDGLFMRDNSIEYIQKVDDDTICVVNRIKKNGEQVYEFSVYQNLNYGEPESKEYWRLNDVLRDEYFVFEVYYVKDSYKSTDFAGVAIGDNADEVNKIDGVAGHYKGDVWISAQSTNPKGLGLKNFTSYHLLSDGVMIIDYQYVGASDTTEYVLEDYKVTSKNFYPFGSEDLAAENFKILQVQEPIELP